MWRNYFLLLWIFIFKHLAIKWCHCECCVCLYCVLISLCHVRTEGSWSEGRLQLLESSLSFFLLSLLSYSFLLFLSNLSLKLAALRQRLHLGREDRSSTLFSNTLHSSLTQQPSEASPSQGDQWEGLVGEQCSRGSLQQSLKVHKGLHIQATQRASLSYH